MIKANELRVGNWVYPNDENATPYPVLEVLTDKFLCYRARTTYGYYHDSYVKFSDAEPIPLTSKILSQLGFEGDIWKKKNMGLDLVGPEGTNDFIISMSQGEVFAVVMIKQGTGDGFTIQEAAEIQKRYAEKHDEPMDDGAFCSMKMGQQICMPFIKYLHELQNMWYIFTGEDLITTDELILEK